MSTNVSIPDQVYDDFRRGYVEGMLFANAFDYNDDGEPYTDDFRYLYQTPVTSGPWAWWLHTPVDLADADEFLRANFDLLASCSDEWDQHGMDFALTRNRHGAGYWDRGYGAAGEELSRLARDYGECLVDLP